ncbi:MAG: EAL domain-containing protein [Pseudomonadota bacterium]
MKNRFLYSSFLLIFFSCISLVFYLHLSRKQEAEHFLAAEKNIHRLIRLSEAMDNDVLAMLSFQLNDFDSLTTKANKIKQARKQLKSNKFTSAKPLPIEGIDQQVELYLSDSWLKLQLLEQLKSNFASYEITLRYIPGVIEQLKELVSTDVFGQINQLYALLLKYRLFSEQQTKQLLMQQINNLAALEFDNKVSIIMENLLFHSRLNLGFRDDLQIIFRHYKKVPSRIHLISIEEQLEDYTSAKTNASFTANTIFLISTALLLSGLIYTLYYFWLERRKATAGRDLFYDAIESIDESFAIYDKNDKLLVWNSKFQHLYPKLDNFLKKGITFQQLVKEGIKRGQFDCSDISAEEVQQVLLVSHKESLKNILESISDGRRYLANNSRTSSGGIASVHIDITERQKMEARLEELSRVVEQNPAAVIITDTKGCISYVNPKFEQHTGYTAQEVLGKNPRILKSGRTTLQEYQKMWETIHSGKVWHGTFYNKKKNGEFFWERAIISAIRNSQNKITAYLAIKEDITKTIADEEQLRMAATVFETSSEGILVTDAQNKIRLVNPSFEKITGYTAKEVLGKSPAVLNSGNNNKEYYLSMWKALYKKGQWQGEIWNKRKNGEIYPQWLSIAVVKDEQNKVSKHVAVFSDISERKKAEEKIHWQANFDQLTELPNRGLFLDRLRQFIHVYQRDKKSFALLFMDLNRFKVVNDTLGHHAGDQLLQMVAKRLSENLSESDTIARFGGDEFTVLLPRINSVQDAGHVAQRIISVLTKPFNINGSDVFIGTSIGITLFPDDADDEISLIRNADMAMYHAKKSGKNSFHFFTEMMNEQMLSRMKLEKDLRYAITNNELFLEFQPVVNCKTGKIIGAEALVRWLHPEYGRLGPDKFITIAEETGMIKQLGEWVIEEALAELTRWHKASYEHLHVAVNVSSAQRLLGLTAEKIQSILDKTGITGQYLIIEITESLMMDNTEESLKWLQSLKQIGLQLSIDDFGTGYSSLSYLHRFPMDILKIDKSFVDEMLAISNSAKLVESIVSLAHHFDLSVVAEGVEEQAQLDFLRKINCDSIQGYYYSKPVTGKDFLNSGDF